MNRIVKERSKKSGLPPGSLVHIGKKMADKIYMSHVDYSLDNYDEGEYDPGKPPGREPHSTVRWINVDGLHHAESIEKLGNIYNIHSLVLEDIMNTDQRPKVEDYGNYLYIASKLIYFDNDRLIFEQVSIILGSNYVLTFQERQGDEFKPIKERLKNGLGILRDQKADYLAYSILDLIVDGYFIVLEKLGERIEEIEDSMMLNPGSMALKEIQRIKRELLIIHKAIWPMREVLAALERRDSKLVAEQTVIYLRDVYDHIVQLMDSVETYRDMVSGMIDIYLTGTSNKMNEVMKVLTIFSTLFMPLTFLAGIYGMNFKYMPELEWRWGYPAIWAIMLITAASMIYYFKRKKWW